MPNRHYKSTSLRIVEAECQKDITSPHTCSSLRRNAKRPFTETTRVCESLRQNANNTLQVHIILSASLRQNAKKDITSPYLCASLRPGSMRTGQYKSIELSPHLRGRMPKIHYGYTSMRIFEAECERDIYKDDARVCASLRQNAKRALQVHISAPL